MRSNLTPISAPDLHYFRAAQGWLELGNLREAHAELVKMAPETLLHPDVLEIQWHLCFKVNQMLGCLQIGSLLLRVAPHRADSWIHTSYAMHRLGRSQEALDTLLPVARQFSDAWRVPYNLSCYCSALGRFDDARDWFIKAGLIDETSALKAGLDDPDLQPLWARLTTTDLKDT